MRISELSAQTPPTCTEHVLQFTVSFLFIKTSVVHANTVRHDEPGTALSVSITAETLNPDSRGNTRKASMCSEAHILDPLVVTKQDDLQRKDRVLSDDLFFYCMPCSYVTPQRVTRSYSKIQFRKLYLSLVGNGT